MNSLSNLPNGLYLILHKCDNTTIYNNWLTAHSWSWPGLNFMSMTDHICDNSCLHFRQCALIAVNNGLHTVYPGLHTLQAICSTYEKIMFPSAFDVLVDVACNTGYVY